VDTSAFVKLALDEPEETALREQLDAWDGLVSSALLQVEAFRACARYGLGPSARAAAGLGAVTLIPLDDRVLDAAAVLEPPTLRSLDAIHLATALSLEDDLGAMFVYDERLAQAARAAGLRVEAPT
jgi:predicted nucleic acid-binding protein